MKVRTFVQIIITQCDGNHNRVHIWVSVLIERKGGPTARSGQPGGVFIRKLWSFRNR
jgi:hypothetical protein